MNLSRRSVIASISGTLTLLTFNRAAFVEPVVLVALWDKGEASMDGTDPMLPMGTAMPGVMMDMATIKNTVDTTEIQAEEVTFSAVNEITEILP